MERRAVSDRGGVWMGQPRGLPVRDAGTRARALPRRPGARADAALAYLPPMIPRDLGLALAPIVLWLAMCAAVARRGCGGARGSPAGWFLATPAASLRPVDRHDCDRRASLGDLAGSAGMGRGHLRLAGAAGNRLPQVPRVRADRTAAADRAERHPVAGRRWHLVAARAGRPRPARRSRPQMATCAIVLVAIPAVAVLGREHLAAIDAGLHGVPTPLVRWLRDLLLFLVLALCIPAGVAANALVVVLPPRARPAAIAAALLVIVVAVGSTALASATVGEKPAHSGLVCSHLPIYASNTPRGAAR